MFEWVIGICAVVITYNFIRGVEYLEDIADNLNTIKDHSDTIATAVDEVWYPQDE